MYFTIDEEIELLESNDERYLRLGYNPYEEEDDETQSQTPQ